MNPHFFFKKQFSRIPEIPESSAAREASMPVTASSSARSFAMLLDFSFFLLVSGLDNPVLMQKPS